MSKIDIRDLRVGNWIRITEPDNFAGAMVKISSLSNQKGAYFAVTVDDPEFGYYTREVFCEDIGPIPLTEEILIKNGLSEGGVSICPQYFIEDGQIYIGVTLKETPDMNEGVLLFNGKRSLQYDGKIEYVHQLQNLLRDLGIEKEIII